MLILHNLVTRAKDTHVRLADIESILANLRQQQVLRSAFSAGEDADLGTLITELEQRKRDVR